MPEIEKRIKMLRLDWVDTNEQNLWKEKEWDQLCELTLFVESALKEGNALIFCAQGKSRSASAAISFLMAKKRASVEEILREVKQKRSLVDPNTNFLSQLKKYGNSEQFSNLLSQIQQI